MAHSLEIVFCIDFSLTMLLFYEEIKKMITNFVNISGKGQLFNMRIGLVTFRSTTDRFFVLSRGMTNNIEELKCWLASDTPDGGVRGGDREIGKKKSQFHFWLNFSKCKLNESQSTGQFHSLRFYE